MLIYLDDWGFLFLSNFYIIPNVVNSFVWLWHVFLVTESKGSLLSQLFYYYDIQASFNLTFNIHNMTAEWLAL